jgi:hypothetical protein
MDAELIISSSIEAPRKGSSIGGTRMQALSLAAVSP